MAYKFSSALLSAINVTYLQSMRKREGVWGWRPIGLFDGFFRKDLWVLLLCTVLTPFIIHNYKNNLCIQDPLCIDIQCHHFKAESR